MAQINGRNAISWDKKFSYNVEYVEKISFLLDLKILLKTVQKVIARKDIQNQTDRPMPRFTGSKLN